MTTIDTRTVGADLPSCANPVTLTDAEWSFLDTLPDPMFVVEWVLSCQLQRGHAGPHLANGQDSGTDEWWLRWDDAGRETVCLPPCPATGPEPGSADERPCLLPDTHDGRHSYQLRPAS